MIIEDIKYMLLRDLHTLYQEISLCVESELWVTKGDIKNPIGTLGLHIAGNLRHYIGMGIGHTGYIRNRPLEFADRSATRQQILDGLAAAKEEVIAALGTLKDSDLGNPYPDISPWSDKTIGHVLLLLITHLSYHLGQVNYLRRGMLKE